MPKTTTPVHITSFGYLHDSPPTAHLTADLRVHFRDPHVSPELRHMTAADEPVRTAVMHTPGIRDVIDALALGVMGYRAGPSAGPVTVAVGCAGGRHRAATVAAALYDRLSRDGVEAEVTHRDLHRAVVAR